MVAKEDIEEGTAYLERMILGDIEGLGPHSDCWGPRGRLKGLWTMIDAQGIAAVGGLMLAMITLIGGWVYWLFRDLRNDLRANIQDLRNDTQANIQDAERANIQDLENKMDRNHQATLTLLQGHTHADDESAVFHRLPDADD